MAIKLTYSASPRMVMAAGYATGRGRRKEREQERLRKTAAQERAMRYDYAKWTQGRLDRFGMAKMQIGAQEDRDVFLADRQSQRDWTRQEAQAGRDTARFEHETGMQGIALAAREKARVYEARESKTQREAEMERTRITGLHRVIRDQLNVDPATLSDAAREQYSRLSGAYSRAGKQMPEDQGQYLAEISDELTAVELDKETRRVLTPEEIGKAGTYTDRKTEQRYTIGWRSGHQELKPVGKSKQELEAEAEEKYYDRRAQAQSALSKPGSPAAAAKVDDYLQETKRGWERERDRRPLEADMGLTPEGLPLPQSQGIAGTEPSGQAGGGTVPQPQSQAEFDELPSGTPFRDPEGNLRRKP